MDSTDFVLGRKPYASGPGSAQAVASVPTRAFADYAHANNRATNAFLAWVRDENPTPEQIADEIIADVNRKRQLVRLALEGRGGDGR